MRNFKEELIEKIELEDFNYEFPFYGPEKDEEGDDINNNVESNINSDLSSISIDTIINTLLDLKQKGADRVCIDTHIDHQSYIFYGTKLTEMGEQYEEYLRLKAIYDR